MFLQKNIYSGEYQPKGFKLYAVLFSDFFLERFYRKNVAKQVGDFWDIAHNLDVMTTEELDALRCKALKYNIW